MESCAINEYYYLLREELRIVHSECHAFRAFIQEAAVEKKTIDDNTQKTQKWVDAEAASW